MTDHNVTLPSKPRIVKEEEFSGVYEIDGLYPGYGHTLGNSLRRIILSSLPGAAITAVKIEGIQHEFSTLKGMKEDVITFLLNLKKVRLELLSDEPQTLTLDAKGPATVTAGNIKLPAQVRILNPEQHLAELTEKGTTLKVELSVERGLGYVPKESLHKERVEVGTIALDAIFTPIRRVNYEVENMRVGERTDFNRLRISIETDGTIEPRTAFEKAIEVMIIQLKSIIGFKEEAVLAPEEQTAGTSEIATSAKIPANDTEFLKTRIETLDLSSRTINALTGAGVRTVGGLVRKREEDLLELEGLGQKGVQEIKRLLSEFGATLRE